MQHIDLLGMAQPIYMGYPYIRVYTVYTVGHFSVYTGPQVPYRRFLNGEHGVHGVWRELSRRQIV